MFEDEVRTPLPLYLDKPLKNKALQGVFLVTLRLIKWIIGCNVEKLNFS